MTPRSLTDAGAWANEDQAAFHGITYAWVLAVMPQSEDQMSFDAEDDRRTLVFARRDGSVRDDTVSTTASSSCCPRHSITSMTSGHVARPGSSAVLALTDEDKAEVQRYELAIEAGSAAQR
jgi:hypothetical protein